MPKVKHLVVKSPNYLSDHSQVITWINLRQTTNTINNTPLQPPISKLPYNIFGTIMNQMRILRKH